jgi:L-arabinose transport system substrate-binding protein
MPILRVFNTALLLAVIALSGCERSDPAATTAASAPSEIKIGFLVKDPSEPWFQHEWSFAQQAADADGFKLIPIGATDGEKVMSAIDTLAAQGAQGFVICTPDTKLGPAIVAAARANNQKLISVDDQFIGADGHAMDVVYVGISATEIGRTAGKALDAEMKKRGWKPQETGLLLPTHDELITARQRTDGAREALVEAGFPNDRIYPLAQKTLDLSGGFDAANIVLLQHPDVKQWLIAGINDEAVLGAVRATEGRGLTAENVIGVGIGGTTGVDDFRKARPTGFFASVLLSPRRHGFETADSLFHWIKDNKEPPKTTYTSGILIDRTNWEKIMREQGLLK